MRCSPSGPELKFAIFRENRSRAHGERMKTKRHFVQPIRNNVIQIGYAHKRTRRRVHFFLSFFFWGGGGGGGFAEVSAFAHLFAHEM